MNNIRTLAEPLTIAYIAIGAKTALKKAQERGNGPNMDRFGGELGFFDAAIEHALLLDRLADDQDLDGCFSYEVAEPFGERVGALLATKEFIPFSTYRTIAEELLTSIGAVFPA